jgi:MraZ protein
MFFDSSDHPLDAKFRVFVPKRFQEVIPRDEKGNLVVMLTPGDDGCLYLFSMQGFFQSLGDVDTRAFTTEEERLKQRRLSSASTKVTLDASGRLLLNEKQRALIDLQPNEDGKVMVKMVGVMNRAEIWPLHKWDEMEAKLESEERHEIVGGGKDARRKNDGGGD